MFLVLEGFRTFFLGGGFENFADLFFLGRSTNLFFFPSSPIIGQKTGIFGAWGGGILKFFFGGGGFQNFADLFF